MKLISVLLFIGTVFACVRADERPSAKFEPDLFFSAQIRPILESRCFKCHSHEHEIEGELALDTKSGWEVGGESGPAVRPGDLKNSPLIQAIRHLDSDTAMPPKKKLPPLEIALLETWVMLGAPDPRTSDPKRED